MEETKDHPLIGKIVKIKRNGFYDKHCFTHYRYHVENVSYLHTQLQATLTIFSRLPGKIGNPQRDNDMKSNTRINVPITDIIETECRSVRRV